MNLLLTDCFKYTNEQLHLIKSLGFHVHFLQQESEPLPLNPSEIDAIVCNGLFLAHNIDDFSKLKFIQLTSAGLDRVPVERIKERRIQLYNARGVYSTPMAEWAVFRVLEYYKQGWWFKKEQSSGRWEKHRGLREISGKRIAVVGAGSVGQEVAKRFHVFNTEITGFDIHTNPLPLFENMELISSLKERIGNFDIIIITAPLLPSTYHLFSSEVLFNIKTNAVLVNIARGGLIDEQSLCDFLQKRQDVFAALDVFEVEPLPIDSLLWDLDNVAISPHNSFVSEGNNKRMFDVIYNNLKTYFNRE